MIKGWSAVESGKNRAVRSACGRLSAMVATEGHLAEPLLRDLTRPQVACLAVIGGIGQRHQAWPVFSTSRHSSTSRGWTRCQ